MIYRKSFMDTCGMKQDSLNILYELRENYGAVGLKGEFETEGITFDEALSLKQMAVTTGLDFTLKIGGCGSLRDLRDTKTLGADFVVAPMIESAYALKKYMETVESAYGSRKERLNAARTKFLVNIETFEGFKNLDEILRAGFEHGVSGVVLGRTDLAASLGLKKNEVNGGEILKYAKSVAAKALGYGMDLNIGGGVCPASVSFFKEIGAVSFKRFETRKIVFDSRKALESGNLERGISLAIDFELLWLKNRQRASRMFSREDEERLRTLEARLARL